MSGALRTTVGVYGTVKRIVTSLILAGFGLVYLAIGGLVMRQCWPRLNFRHASYWWSPGVSGLDWLLVLAIGLGIGSFYRSAPRPFRGMTVTGVFAYLLFFDPISLRTVDHWLEPVALAATFLLIIGLMNVLEALPAGGTNQRQAIKTVAAQNTLGKAGDASEAQAVRALRGERQSPFGRRGRSADDQEF